MTIKEIDKQGYAVKFMKHSSVSGRGTYTVILLEKNDKLFIAWKPDGHMEYTAPFQIPRSQEIK